jgi:hypothetical protein
MNLLLAALCLCAGAGSSKPEFCYRELMTKRPIGQNQPFTLYG